MARPRYPKPDKNNDIAIRALEDLGGLVKVDAPRLRYTVIARGQRLTALNISSMPNQTDWLILSDAGWYMALEIKARGKENDLTPGEREWAEDVGLVVASNVDTIRYAILERMAEDDARIHIEPKETITLQGKFKYTGKGKSNFRLNDDDDRMAE